MATMKQDAVIRVRAYFEMLEGEKYKSGEDWQRRIVRRYVMLSNKHHFTFSNKQA